MPYRNQPSQKPSKLPKQPKITQTNKLSGVRIQSQNTSAPKQLNRRRIVVRANQIGAKGIWGLQDKYQHVHTGADDIARSVRRREKGRRDHRYE